MGIYIMAKPLNFSLVRLSYAKNAKDREAKLVPLLHAECVMVVVSRSPYVSLALEWFSRCSLYALSARERERRFLRRTAAVNAMARKSTRKPRFLRSTLTRV